MNKTLYIAIAAVAPGLASAAVILDFNTNLSNQPPVNGNQLLARLTINNAGANTVNMSFEHFANPDTARYIGGLWLNVDPYKNVSLVGIPTAPISSVSSAMNGISAPGGQYLWDLFVDFEQAPPGDRMFQGRTVNFSLTGTNLLETDFLALAGKTQGHNDDLYGLIHIQGVENTPGIDSSWYGAVPEPCSMIALGAGLATLAARRRRRA